MNALTGDDGREQRLLARDGERIHGFEGLAAILVPHPVQRDVGPVGEVRLEGARGGEAVVVDPEVRPVGGFVRGDLQARGAVALVEDRLRLLEEEQVERRVEIFGEPGFDTGGPDCSDNAARRKPDRSGSIRMVPLRGA